MLTGGIHDNLTLKSSIQTKVICLIWSQLISLVVSERAPLRILKVRPESTGLWLCFPALSRGILFANMRSLWLTLLVWLEAWDTLLCYESIADKLVGVPIPPRTAFITSLKVNSCFKPNFGIFQVFRTATSSKTFPKDQKGQHCTGQERTSLIRWEIQPSDGTASARFDSSEKSYLSIHEINREKKNLPAF